MKKILVTGANGFLGQHLTLYLLRQGYHVIASGRGHCRIPFENGLVYAAVELTDKASVENVLQLYNPEVIVHAAAVSKPDECNVQQELCMAINVEATKNLLHPSVSHFIYLSTDFIFGENGPHAEDDLPDPLNFYGATKLMAEQAVKQSGLSHSIVRPVFIYGEVWEGLRANFLYWVKQNLEQGKSIKVVNDQLRTPTYVGDICKGIHAIIDQKAMGVFHLAGSDIVSPYEMAVITAQTLQLDASLIQQVTSDTFPEPVKRAKRSGLKIDKAVRELGYAPVEFKEGVHLSFGL